MSTRFLVPALISGMILTGACNSLWSKYQDMQCVENCDDPDPRRHVLYEQPVWQTLQMFRFLPVLYEYLSKRWRAASIRLPEEDSDSTLAELSESQKLQPKKLTGPYRNNVLFLRRKLHLYQYFSWLQWFSCQRYPPLDCSVFRQHVRSDDTYRFAGERDRVFFIMFAQIFTATQFVVEEKILGQYSIPPLLAVGYEGLFGTISVLFLMPLLPLVKLPPSSPAAAWFDLVRGWHKLVDTPSVLFIACSIALFNFFSLSVTKYVSATARSLTDTCRTLAIWIVSLTLGWEILMWPISLLQVAGFGLLVYGTFLFNNLVQPPRFLRPSEGAILVADAGVGDEDAPLLSATDALDETARLPADLGTSGYDAVPTETQGAGRGRNGN
ncbi:hypothetical protein EDB84DRAFT_1671712 [Lactarius hengduanensis]|nr:hypothetical protein EDB84DRAFT_1671712 [Lactarius hengduanensis]